MLWWLIPGELAGMPMPFIHVSRRMEGGGPLDAFEDDLPVLYAEGIRAVVSLLNVPRDAPVYDLAGFVFLCLPVSDGAAPTFDQAEEFIGFVSRQRAAQHPVVVHCEAGLGRTGTMLAAYLISRGKSASDAIRQIRSVEKAAIETSGQIRFLEQFAVKTRSEGDPPVNPSRFTK